MTNKDLVSRIYNIKNPHKSTVKTTNNPIRKWAKDMNRYFTKKELQVSKKHAKVYSTLLVIRE